MPNKEIERKILNLVYRNEACAEIVDSEEPDFRIKLLDQEDYFGVEVTTFHYTESYARLRNIPDYFEEIIFEGKYRHRIDKKELEAVEIAFYDPEGNETSKTKALFRKRTDIKDHGAMITEVLSGKESSLSRYQQDLTHINLIIFDAEAGFWLFEKSEYYLSLFTEELRCQLYKSRYREVFLVTLLEKQWVYIPLKMVLLVGEWYLFHKLIFSFFPERAGKYQDQFMILFAQYMQYRTGNAFFRRRQKYDVEVLWANTGVMLAEGSNSIFDYADQPFFDDVITPTLKGVSRFFKSKVFQE